MRPAILTFVLAFAAASQERPDADARLLKWMDSIAQEQLDRRAAEIAKIRTVADAERRKQLVRAKLLELNGGLPDYNGPLNPQVTGRLEHPGYSIEKVIFESLPRVHVTANLYRPNQPGRYPGVLLPLGHWEQGKPGPQRIAANLALKGFVVLVYDPLGQGERWQAFDRRVGRSLAGGSTDQHFMAGAQSLLIGESFARYRIWDAKRALDYLVSRPDVDAEKIGCTGCSGGGTLTTYISALDTRIKVAAPACYMNSFRVLFSGSVGDSEQSLPDFLSSGLDQTDYVELFAPKPWLICSTLGDFFTPEGARQVYEEAQAWYRIYGAEDKIRWAVGRGPHGTPLEIREEIYAWMIRWLKDGKGSAAEQAVEMHPDLELQVTKTGQVATDLGSRDIYEVIRENLQKGRRPGTTAELLETIRRWSSPPRAALAAPRVLSETGGPDYTTERFALEVEPGLEIEPELLVPRKPGRMPAVLLAGTDSTPGPVAARLARAGNVVLYLAPRGLPGRADTRGLRLLGGWLAATRAWLIGRNLPALRAHDIRRGVDLLAARPEVDPARIRAVARETAGIWLLLAAALDNRIGGVWLDRTPHSLRAALDQPLHRNLHDAVMPGFALRWDLEDLVKAIEPRRVLWSDPTDWMGRVLPLGPAYRYRPLDGSDEPYIEALMR
ncbi:MAG: acetylxylan esterase [Acidobacteriota bacterium]